MYKISLIAVGKMKSGPHETLVSDYLRRLKSYAKITVHEVPEKSFRSIAEREQVLKQEAEKITTAIPEGAFVIVLDADGKALDSTAFASELDRQSEHGTRELVFVIGSALGLHDEVKKRADLRLSLSPLTFPHDLARVVLMEQLYRTMTILNKKTYHY